MSEQDTIKNPPIDPNENGEKDVVKNNPAIPDTYEDEDDEEILALKDQVKQKIKEKSNDEPTYSKKELDNIIKQLEKKFQQKQENQDEDFIDLLDPNAVKRKFVRLTRLNNKFVVGIKNMNEDTYVDIVVDTINVEHPTRKGELIPWSTYIYEDGSEELYPVLSFQNRGVGVWAEVVEEKKKDISKTFGLVDVKTLDESNEWDLKSTGKKVLAKALQYRTTYVVKEIKGGRILEVSEDVINKSEASYADLKKFIDESK